ncbi:MAG: carbohydrate ABC transporter permease [Chloroflexota bacterium]
MASVARTDRMPKRRWNVGKAAVFILLLLGAAVMAFPFIWMVLTSLKQPEEVHRWPMTWFPDNWLYFDNYVSIISGRLFGRFLLNSTIVTFGAVLSSLFFSALSGYAFAKLRFPGKEICFVAVLAVFMMPFEVTMLPLYLLFSDLSLTNTYLGIMAPDMISAFGVFIMRQFMAGIPGDYIEAARIDGAGELRIFAAIALPITVPALLTLAVIKTMWVWNGFLWPLIIAQDEAMMTIPVGLSAFAGAYYTEYTLITAAAFVSVLPLLVLFVLLQRFVQEGVVLTGLKG